MEAISFVLAMSISTKDSLPGQDKNPLATEGIFTVTPQQRDALVCDGFFPAELARSMRNFYEREGYVLVRGLLEAETMRKLQKAVELSEEDFSTEGYVAKNFQSMKFNPILLGLPPPPANGSEQETEREAEENVLKAFRETALHSGIPVFIAEILLQLDRASGDTLRVVNDVFLAKDGREEQAAGWHVDDRGFWPCSAHQESSVPVGVNAWIAVNDIPSQRVGGGMAIVPRSHLEEGYDWVREGYETIGSTKLEPLEGYSDLTEFLKSRKHTTEMERTNPQLYAKIDKLKKSFDYREGDVLLMSRWLWHRSEQRKSHYGSGTFMRYTVRYDVGRTKLFSGISTVPAVVYDKSNAGKTLDEICRSTGLPFYPEAWPRLPGSIDEDAELNGMRHLLHDINPNAMAANMEMLTKIRNEIQAKSTKNP